VPTVACDVGGLADLTTIVVAPTVDPATLAHAVDQLLTSPPPRTPGDPVEATVAAHRRAYGLEEPRPERE